MHVRDKKQTHDAYLQMQIVRKTEDVAVSDGQNKADIFSNVCTHCTRRILRRFYIDVMSQNMPECPLSHHDPLPSLFHPVFILLTYLALSFFLSLYE
jgi:hypothetical protein